MAGNVEDLKDYIKATEAAQVEVSGVCCPTLCRSSPAPPPDGQVGQVSAQRDGPAEPDGRQSSQEFPARAVVAIQFKSQCAVFSRAATQYGASVGIRPNHHGPGNTRGHSLPSDRLAAGVDSTGRGIEE